jgi:hypothetical protein
VTDDANRREWAASFQRASWGCAPAIGRALGLSARSVEHWGSPDSGKRSPGERLEILISTALEHRKPHDALAPLHLLAERFGYALQKNVAGGDPTPASDDVNRTATSVLLEASEAVQSVIRATEDGILTREEVEEISRECDEAIEALQRLKASAREMS